MNTFKLNTDNIYKALIKKGYSQKQLASFLDVSPQAVSYWLNGIKMPEPNRLYKMCELLDIQLTESIVKVNNYSYAFRRNRNSKATLKHNEAAEDMASCLEELVPVIQDDLVCSKLKLNEPKLEYQYIKKVADKIRNYLNTKNEIISKEHIIDFLQDKLNTVIIPVLWGEKKSFATALEITFNKVSFLYLNINSNQDDINFWLLHEISHLLTPALKGEESEMFADQLSTEILFSQKETERLLDLSRSLNNKEKYDLIIDHADRINVNPYTIAKSIEHYCKNNKTDYYDLDTKELHKLMNFRKIKKPLISQKISSEELIAITEQRFKSDFFKYLKEYLTSNIDAGAMFVKRILNIGYYDAVELYNELMDGTLIQDGFTK